MSKATSSSQARKWTLQGLLGAAVLGLGVSSVMLQVDQSSQAVAAQQVSDAEAKCEGLDLIVYSHAMQIRREAGLLNRDLAAIGLTEQEATSVLRELVSWCESNSEGIAAAQRKVNVAQRELHEIERLVRIGQATDQELSDAANKVKELVEAKQACDELFKQAAAHAMQNPGIAFEKVEACERALELKAKNGSDVRYLERMDAPRLDELAAEVKRQEKEGIEEVLSYSEDQELKEVRGRIQLLLPGIVAAEEAAMPLPHELQPPPEEELGLVEDFEGVLEGR